MNKNISVLSSFVNNFVNNRIPFISLCCLLFSFVFIGCTNQSDYVEEKMVEDNAILNKRSYQEALNAAYNAINSFDNNAITRANGESKKLNLASGVKYVTGPSLSVTRSASSHLDTLMYVFNFEDEQGYVIISASKNTPPMIALADDGFYDPSESQENKGFAQAMDNAIQYVRESFDNPVRFVGPITPIDPSPVYTLLSSVGNFISVRWGQTGVEGVYCPNGISGCVNTASAMLMSYYEYPETIALQHDGYTNPNYTLEWTEMKKHKRNHQYSDFPEPFLFPADSIQAHDMISHMCRQLGVCANSTYYSSSTGTSISGLLSSMSTMGYSTLSRNNYTQDGLISILDSQHPVYMIGGFYDNDYQWNGHAWLVDGYRYYSIFDPMAIYYDNNGNLVNGETYYCYYNHINWGWDGRNDGYFISNCFSTSAGFTYDYEERISGSANFNLALEIFNFYPNI